jgi:hypothetical protein
VVVTTYEEAYEDSFTVRAFVVAFGQAFVHRPIIDSPFIYCN